MSVGLALLVSADPVTIQQFSHALRELSILHDVCQEVPTAVGLLNPFDAVIVDLQVVKREEPPSGRGRSLFLRGLFLPSQFTARSSLPMD